ncbi:bifunctional tRNA (5-methylaminomethyl-2-thiouridine)(34)-methyltransferase MnmD/FAD-dependent 5-carboxymethylaminomethyl-2-thiouridine(34) oxidoreductase MnmC [Endozoicomonas arenosclerae]|uniref:bifunctional tRNA (5-methylaminomethyl-2-thiouridine)(34)-methyltransferase MnmD/FAD-dependent 5-carboxymethylaminomethyl-2-thiouridine(34) oxidoreductase MnmC n=1 Tax=Endozoicomonas arenosclerae TaxID=1633495 RepID=UPI000781E223|nr:bifunctional tRNA (5-methylaminomethyl-2-thiouridine)(34)-methyltransferase MnmD/FAD-dependent 5-carboxymethylaminomethyl-2-thiouridine(34) oxidoreductase MnmC [Endozoicomonas arenosclerae]
MSKKASSEPQQPTSQTLTHADLEWKENGQPVSTTFDDVYFSTVSGLKETHHVFIDSNALPERFEALKQNDCFTIGETGFGTGLNFLCAWALFEQIAPATARLHFVSTEKYPLSQKDLQQALSMWPELSEYSKPLVECYMPAMEGQQHFSFAMGRIKLTLCLGDVLKTLPDLEGKVDAWFLDGFSPAKNPDMWQPELFTAMAAKSHLETTYATFTSARGVRDGLSEAGFSVEKTIGFGHKREMVKGRLIKEPEVRVNKPLWFQDNLQPEVSDSNRSAVIVGGGLAGCSTAMALAERGWKVTLLEQHNGLAREASGNPQGILYTKLSANRTPLSRFITEGYLYTIHLLKSLVSQQPELWQQSGVVQLAINEKVRKRHLELTQHFPNDLLSFLTASELSDVAGLPVEQDGLYFPEAGWVHPALFCQTLAHHENINIVTNTQLQSLEKAEKGWTLNLNGGNRIQSQHVIIACAKASTLLPQMNFIPLKNIRGQITEIEATKESSHLKTTVCGEGYAAPAFHCKHTIGATFDFNNESTEVTDEGHQKNLMMQKECAPALYHALGGEQATILDGRASFRCTTPDYLPAVGTIVDQEQFLEDFAMLRKNVKHHFTQTPKYLEGLYINAGHGSRGLITAPLSGELLAAQLSGECSPITSDLLNHLSPTRFLVRGMSRNQI